MRSLLFATKPATPVLWAGLALVLLGLVPAAARADFIIGNLERRWDGSTLVTHQFDVIFMLVPLPWEARLTPFRTSRLDLPSALQVATTFQLESDAAGNPSGTVLFTFTNPTFGSGTRPRTRSPQALPSLSLPTPRTGSSVPRHSSLIA